MLQGEVSKGSWANTMGPPSTAAPLVAQLRTRPGHPLRLDDLSLFDADHVDASRRLSTAQLTDTYLLALARTHKGKLASFESALTI
ncbi:hypothetical protein KQH60_03830 [Mycetohabitans sp. B8]|uniref:hypothetical protein n=1 Tax=Mycetohabitans sp. B8 TaxID=2841845 RepID=UPI001F45FD47|nr:hypothetical protein [Mycetohabitans sp. B8]MCG1041748.1 hypothetical protein [Mycetohabitans sp. B8]